MAANVGQTRFGTAALHNCI